MYKIQWSHHTVEEATWETEYYLNENYPGLHDSRQRKFLPQLSSFKSYSRDEISFKG
jgi:hypothetical protein